MERDKGSRLHSPQTERHWETGFIWHRVFQELQALRESPFFSGDCLSSPDCATSRIPNEYFPGDFFFSHFFLPCSLTHMLLRIRACFKQWEKLTLMVHACLFLWQKSIYPQVGVATGPGHGFVGVIGPCYSVFMKRASCLPEH